MKRLSGESFFYAEKLQVTKAEGVVELEYYHLATSLK